MRNLVFIGIILLLAGGVVFAISEEPPIERSYRNELFTQDARVLGMGGAFTAVADDVYALYYNPAGLAYLNGIDLLLGFTVYGDLYGPDVDKIMEEDDEDVEIPFNGISFIPRAAYAAKNWGIAAISDIGIEVNEINEEEEYIDLKLTHKAGLSGAIGYNLGPIAVGANLRLYKSLTVADEDSKINPANYEDFADLFEQKLQPLLIEDLSNAPTEMKVGVGAMASLGTLTAGAYVDSFLDLIKNPEDDEEPSEEEYNIFSEALKTANIGAAFTPFKNRLRPSNVPLNFVLAADLNNIGDDDNRSLSIGTELGIHLGGAITADIRGGYRQPLLGDIEEVEINTEEGELFFGLGAKVLIVDLNFGVSLPATFAEAAAEAEDEENLPTFADHGDPRFIISGGIRL